MENLKKEEIEKIIKIAFKDGEQWGITHHDWFIPTEKDVNERINQTVSDIFKMFGIDK